jgi:hypothetical protein
MLVNELIRSFIAFHGDFINILLIKLITLIRLSFLYVVN